MAVKLLDYHFYSLRCDSAEERTTDLPNPRQTPNPLCHRAGVSSVENKGNEPLIMDDPEFGIELYEDEF